MTMRGLIWFVLLFAAAAGLALVGVFDGGQVLLIPAVSGGHIAESVRVALGRIRSS